MDFKKSSSLGQLNPAVREKLFFLIRKRTKFVSDLDYPDNKPKIKFPLVLNALKS